jgi:hypothetical protein
MTDTLDYGSLMHRAMRGLIFDVLEQVRDHGLPGNHHFFITFDTTHPDVQLADWLKDRYPAEMTVVIQHWFDNLVVREDGFSITLNFGDQPEPIHIPFDAIQTFVDPSVEFGLRFENQDMDEIEEDAEADETELSADTTDASDEEPRQEAQVVSLDQFRR